MGNLHRMRAERKKKGISLSEICQKTGLNERQVCNYETTIRQPNSSIYNQLAKIFGWKVWHECGIELLHCPFCGGEAAVLYTYDNRDAVIQCSECNSKTDYHSSFFDAAEAWNRRAKNAKSKND